MNRSTPNVPFAGAKGYLNKQEATRNIINAIRRVLSGDVYLSEKMSALIVRRMAGASRGKESSPIERLTDRELEIFQFLGQGDNVKAIAANLHISVKTVEAHREHIKLKLKFKSSAELVRYAIQSAMQSQ